MKAVIFGSNGFIGSHLAEELKIRNFEVLSGDRKGNVPVGMDYVFDCASYGNIFGQDDVEEIYKANVDRVIAILNHKNTKTAKAIVLTSSSSVGMGHQTDYAVAKRVMEKRVLSKDDLPVTIVRPYTVYGIDDNQSHLIPRVFNSCMDGRPLELSLKPVHDYIWVEDLINIYTSCIDDDKTIGKVLEGGTGVPTSNAEVVVLIESLTGKKANISSFIPAREYDSSNWFCRNPISPFVSLFDGLRMINNDKQRTKKENT